MCMWYGVRVRYMCASVACVVLVWVFVASCKSNKSGVWDAVYMVCVRGDRCMYYYYYYYLFLIFYLLLTNFMDTVMTT